MAKLSIIVPAYNEEQTILSVLNKINSVNLINHIEKEVIVVNDCSKDQTEQVVLDYIKTNPSQHILYFKHDVNQGKGAALHTGIKQATGDYVIVQDADLEYDPAEFNLLLKPMVDGFADVVYGSRFIGGRPHRALFFLHTIGNKLLTFTCNALTNLNITDMETCYKLFKREIIQGLNLKEKRFGFEPEVTIKMAKIPKIRIYEVGISYYGRTYDEGKKIGWKDGVRAFYCMMKYGLFKFS